MDSSEHRASIDRVIVDSDPASELAANFSETARILFSAGSVTDTLAQVVGLPEATIEGCDFAGLFFVEKDVVTSPIHTDPIVDQVDALQQENGEGPSLTKWEPLGLDWPGQGTKTAGGSDPVGGRSAEGSDQGADQPELTDKEGTELIGYEVGRALP